MGYIYIKTYFACHCISILGWRQRRFLPFHAYISVLCFATLLRPKKGMFPVTRPTLSKLPDSNIFFLFSENKNSKSEKRSCFSLKKKKKKKKIPTYRPIFFWHVTGNILFFFWPNRVYLISMYIVYSLTLRNLLLRQYGNFCKQSNHYVRFKFNIKEK